MDYDKIVENIFTRFPSFQSHGSQAYHPGLANMQAFDTELGHPHRAYRCVHVAGTNGKGSVSSMIASSLAARGFRTGLYTSPHLVDFRERARNLFTGASAGEVKSSVNRERIFWDS